MVPANWGSKSPNEVGVKDCTSSRMSAGADDKGNEAGMGNAAGSEFGEVWTEASVDKGN